MCIAVLIVDGQTAGAKPSLELISATLRTHPFRQRSDDVHEDLGADDGTVSIRVVRPTGPRLSPVSALSSASAPSSRSVATTPCEMIQIASPDRVYVRPNAFDTLSTDRGRVSRPCWASSRSTAGRMIISRVGRITTNSRNRAKSNAGSRSSGCPGRTTKLKRSEYRYSKFNPAIRSGLLNRPTTISSSPWRSRSISTGLVPEITRTVCSGWRAMNDRTASGIRRAATVGSTPTVTYPPPAARTASTLSSPRRNALSTASA